METINIGFQVVSGGSKHFKVDALVAGDPRGHGFGTTRIAAMVAALRDLMASMPRDEATQATQSPTANHRAFVPTHRIIAGRRAGQDGMFLAGAPLNAAGETQWLILFRDGQRETNATQFCDPLIPGWKPS